MEFLSGQERKKEVCYHKWMFDDLKPSFLNKPPGLFPHILYQVTFRANNMLLMGRWNNYLNSSVTIGLLLTAL